MTARRVAAHRASFARVQAPFGRAAEDQLLQEAVADGIQVDATTLMARYLRVRTTFFDHAVVDAIAAGMRQFVAVGAGYDGRSLRYEHPDVRWFELDHPDSQTDKRARLEALHIDSDRIGFASADFLQDHVGDALVRAGHDPGTPTRFLCEGVAGYLSADVLSALVTWLRRAASPGSSLVITLSLEPVAGDQSATRGGLGRAVASMGEELQSSFPRDGVVAWFAAAGWTVEQATDPAGTDILRSERTSAFVVAVPR